MPEPVILLTGTSNGMGNVAVRTLAAKGYRVFATMRDVKGKNAAAAAKLQELSNIEVIELDIADDQSVNAGVEEIVKRAGRIDIAVNCAGVFGQGIAESFSTAQFLNMLNTNTAGPLRLFKAVLPGMRERGSGLIITITSLMGRMIVPGSAIYCATKFALEALAEGVAQEVSRLGVESVIVEPGAFATNLMANPIVPEDQHVGSGYGAYATPQEEMNAAIGPLIARTNASIDPQLVADLLADLIALPAGQRPLRVTVGMDMGIGRMNDAMAPVQAEALDMLGMRAWDPRVSAA